MTEATIAKLSVLLGADSTAYERGMKNARRGNQDFEASAKRLMGSVVAAFAAIGGAIKSAEVIIKSTQGTSDGFAAAMGGAKEATNRLAQAVAEANFSNLWTNLEMAYRAGKRYTEVLDDIADRQRSVDIKKSENDLEITRLKGILQLTTATKQERIDAAAQIRKLTNEQFKIEEDLAKIRLDNEMNLIKDTYKLSDAQKDQVLNYIKNYNLLTDEQKVSIKNAETLRNEYLAWLKNQKTYTDNKGEVRIIGDETKLNEWKAKLTSLGATLTEQERAYAVLGPTLNKVVDEQRDRIASIIVDWNNAKKALQEYINSANKGEARATNKKDNYEPDPLNIDFKESEADIEEWMTKLWAQPPSPSVPAVDVVIESLDLMDEKFESSTSKAAQSYADLLENMNKSTEQFIETTLVELASSMGEAFVTGQWDEVFQNILSGFAGFLQKLGAMMIAYGVAELAFETSPEPLSKIAAGVAMVAIGGAIKGAMKNASITPGSGGSVPSGSSVGSSNYSNANSTRTLKLVWERAGKDLVAIMKEENFSNGSIIGR